MTEMISETCEAHAVYFYPKTGKKCWQDAQAQYIKTNNPVQKQKHKLKLAILDLEMVNKFYLVSLIQIGLRK